MHTGATTAESYTYSSLFPYARPAQSHSVTSSSIPIHLPTEHSGHNAPSGTLTNGKVREKVNDEDDDVFAEMPQAISASCFADSVSSSPAAMFLSAFSSPTPKHAPLPDDEGRIVSGYTLGAIIGYGAFSTIRRAFSPSGDVVAVKIVRRSDHFKRGIDADRSKKRIRHEAQVWETLSHEHILPLFSAAYTDYADYFFTLFCPAGSLFDILKRDGRELPQDDAGMMFRQVVRGLRYLHEVALFVHRDIKLENVLVDELGVCRIGDFGLAKRIGEIDEDDEEAQDYQHEQQTEPFQHGHATVHRAVSLLSPGTRVGPKASSLHVPLARHRNSTSSVHAPTAQAKFQPGSLPYAAPELLLPQSGPIIPHPSQDIWALGVLLFALLTGHLPFSDSFEPRLQMKILNGTYTVPSGIGRGAERVLKGCLDRSDTTRWNIAMVDEVAWGVGWGSENDDITPADSDEEFQVPTRPRSHPRHQLEESIPEDPEWQQEEPSSRPALDAASRRSSSRIQRSLSRAPHSAKRPTLTRSGSRQSRALSPSVPGFDAAVAAIARSPSAARSPSSVRSPSSTRSPYFFDSGIEASAFERGRRRQKFSQSSHSPSPSIAAPTTPSDSLGPDPDIERSTSRGRRRKVEFTTTSFPEHLYTADELDTLDEASQTPAFTRRHGHEHLVDMFVGRRAQRSQSKPSYDPTHAYSASRQTNKRNESTPPNGEAWPRSLGLGHYPISKLLTPVQPTTAVDRRTRSRSLDIVR
ncbi:hypothetical protein DXG01_001240 [Tephrocybe rancida]|nr:hypothetical protein DXG01_001240 [Tephrocybe rancida]